MIMKTRGHRGTTEAGSTVILKARITRPSLEADSPMNLASHWGTTGLAAL